MKTIVERAVEYADKHKATEINYFGVGKVYGYPRIYNAEITAYERGATEQKEIDDIELSKLKSAWGNETQVNRRYYIKGYRDAVEKSCEWLKENIDGGVHPQSAIGFVEKFRKAMEE